MIHKEFSAVQTKVLDESRGLCQTMFAITGNVDRQGDRILPGAFSKALSAKTSVPVVYSHGWQDISQVLGKTTGWTELKPGSPELPPGLLSKGLGGVRANVQFELGVPAGQIAWTHVRNKNLTNWSWAFDVDSDGEKYDGNVREIKGIREIFEITLCPVGANAEAMTMALRKTMELQHGARANDAEQWAFINRYIAKRAADEEAQPTKTISAYRTHVENWLADQPGRANLPITRGELAELMACLEHDEPAAARYLSRNSVLISHAMTPTEFKRLADSVTERN